MKTLVTAVIALAVCQQTAPPAEPYWLDLLRPRDGATGHIQLFHVRSLEDKDHLFGTATTPAWEHGRDVVLKHPLPKRFNYGTTFMPAGRWQIKGFYRAGGSEYWYLVPVKDGQ